MKLQKHLAREYKGKEYYKWTVVLPSSQMRELNWEEGTELTSEIKNGKLVIQPLPEGEKPMSETGPMTPYDEFKTTVKTVLENADDGLTWTEIKERGDLPQKVPNNKWVERLEEEIGLERERIRNRSVWTLTEN